MPKTRTVKKSTVRKNEILNIAETLFAAKGYSKTTIENVIDAAGIAKGTFYHYFNSKEDMLDALIMRYMDVGVSLVQSIAEDPALSGAQKLRKITTYQYRKHTPTRKTLAEMQKMDNTQMFQKTLVEGVMRITPIIAKVLEQGIKEGDFKTQYPYEAMEIMLLLSQFVFEGHILPWTKKDIPRKTRAYTHYIETLFGAKKGSLEYMVKTQKDTLGK